MPTESKLDALDRLIAEKWCGWHLGTTDNWQNADGDWTGYYIGEWRGPGMGERWRPTRNPAHALEAADLAVEMTMYRSTQYCEAQLLVRQNQPDVASWFQGLATLFEVGRDIQKCTALAISRAIEAALDARRKSDEPIG